MITSTDTDARIFAALKACVAKAPPIPRPLISICGWCADARERTRVAHEQGYLVSHSLCGDCSSRIHADLDAQDARAQVA